MITELNLSVSNIDYIVCRLAYSLTQKISKNEMVLMELYNRSINGIYDTSYNKDVMSLLKITKQEYSRSLTALEKKGLIKKSNNVILLNVNLKKRNINLLTIKKNENK